MCKADDENLTRAAEAMEGIRTYDSLKDDLAQAMKDGDIARTRELKAALSFQRRELAKLTREQ